MNTEISTVFPPQVTPLVKAFPKESPDIFSGLSEETLLKIAKESISPECLAHLAKSRYDGVRKTVAENIWTNLSTLEYLANDRANTVCCSVALHRNASTSLLDNLAGHPFRGVRATVAGRQDADLNIIEKLLNDEEDMVRRAANKNIKNRVNEVFIDGNVIVPELKENDRSPHPS